jgi:hypothetical protein
LPFSPKSNLSVAVREDNQNHRQSGGVCICNEHRMAARRL